MFFKLL